MTARKDRTEEKGNGMMEQNGYQYTSDKRKRYYDFTLLFLVIIIIGIGVLMIGSISAYNATKYEGNSMFYLKRQLIYAALGIVGMIVVSLIDYHFYSVEFGKKKFPILIFLGYLFILGLEVLVMVLGKTDSNLNGATNGAARWISVGGIKIQPGEFGKLFIIIISAYIICRIIRNESNPLTKFGFILAQGAIVAAAVKESLTTGIVMAGIVVGLYFIVSKKTAIYVVVGIVGLFSVFLYVSSLKDTKPEDAKFRDRRIIEWQHLEDDSNTGQIKQGLYAISTGGLFGKGFGNSEQKLGHIAEVHTDMIFSCIVEEMGLIGGIAILILFGLLIWRIAIVAINAPDLNGMLICSGVCIHIGLQVVINIGVITGTIPSTGVTLPFISYGGSSLLVLCAEMGLVLNVSRNIGYRKRLAMKEYGSMVSLTESEKTGERKQVFGFGKLHKVKDDHKKKTRPVPKSSKSGKKPVKKTSGTSGQNGKTTGTTRPASQNSGKRPTQPTRPITGSYHIDVELGKPKKRPEENQSGK